MKEHYTLCKCGCKKEVKPGSTFLQGLYSFLFLTGRAMLWYFMAMLFLILLGYDGIGLIFMSMLGASVAYLAYKEVRGGK